MQVQTPTFEPIPSTSLHVLLYCPLLYLIIDLNELRRSHFCTGFHVHYLPTVILGRHRVQMQISRRAPLPHALRVQCAHLLPRLRLIPEFEAALGTPQPRHALSSRPWATYSPHADVQLLYDCLCRGEPLCTLLELLGFKGAGLVDEVESEEPESEDEKAKRSIAEFIKGLRTLELSGKLPYGEIFRVDDLLGGTYAGFSKVRCQSCHIDMLD